MLNNSHRLQHKPNLATIQHEEYIKLQFGSQRLPKSIDLNK